MITSSTGSKTGFGLHSSDTVVYRHFILVRAKIKICGLSSGLVFFYVHFYHKKPFEATADLKARFLEAVLCSL